MVRVGATFMKNKLFGNCFEICGAERIVEKVVGELWKSAEKLSNSATKITDFAPQSSLSGCLPRKFNVGFGIESYKADLIHVDTSDR